MLPIPVYCRNNLHALSEQLHALLSCCVLCPRECRINRLNGETGYCGSGMTARVASYTLHHGEEPPLSGIYGSGAIFFSGCTMRCIFCQNYPISHQRHGREVDDRTLAGYMIELAGQGAHNINLVTPTHVLPAIVRALVIARAKGLTIPIVYNSSGFERVEILRILEHIVDIYMPDAKYATESAAKKYSDAPGYPAANRSALKEMYRQTGNLAMDRDGIAQRGLIVRHLVLPGNIPETVRILSFLKHEISDNVYLSLMAQFHPAHQSGQYPELNKCLSVAEYEEALSAADALGMKNGWRQEL